LEANKLLFEFEFLKNEANCDAVVLDKDFINDNYKNIPLGVITNLINGIEKIR